jgi:hypothetical protein
MSLIKLSSTHDWNWDFDPISIIKGKETLKKAAADESFLKYERTPGQTDLHIIAVGAYEGTGDNRNGDRQREYWCEKNAHYFKKANRAVHRHHKNKPNDPKYGNIKAAAYNKNMRRIELIVGLDNDKCADILHEQEKKGNTNWSMALKTAYDVCTVCGHKSYTGEDRCEHIPAQLGEITKSGEMVAMDNPDPRYFEISYVHRPADRIGMSLRKLAGESFKIKTADYLSIYPDLYEPSDDFIEGAISISKKAEEKRKLLSKLSEIEKQIDAIAKKPDASLTSGEKFIKEKAVAANEDKLSPEVLDELRKLPPAKLFRELAENGIIFSPEDFFRYTFGDAGPKPNVCGCMPTLFSSLNDEKDVGMVVNDEKFEPGPLGILGSLKRVIGSLTDDFSLFPENRGRKIIRIVSIRELKPKPKTEQVKESSAEDLAYARQYASYKLAALNYMQDRGLLDDRVLLNAVLQNRA